MKRGIQDLFALDTYSKLIYCNDLELTKQKNVNFKNTEKSFSQDDFESKLVNSDCLKELKLIKDNSIDFIFADPPYNIKKKYSDWDDAREINDYFEWCDEWMAELARIIKPGHTVAILNIPLWAVRHHSSVSNQLFFQDWIVWEGLSLPLRKIMPAHYGILCLSKGKPRKINTNYEEHYTQKEWYCARSSCVKKRVNSGVEYTAF